MYTKPLEQSLEDRVQRELKGGERLYWTGQPIAKRMALKAIPVSIFAIPWTAFAFYWTYSAAGNKIPDLSRPEDWFALFGLPFIIIGLNMLFAPFWYYRKAQKVVYAITSVRAIIFEGSRNLKVKSYGPERLKNLSKNQKMDGSGDIIFEKTQNSDNREKTDSFLVGFMAVGNVNEVEGLLRKIEEG